MLMPDGRVRRIPFLDQLGITLVDFGKGRSELLVPVSPELCNSRHVAHGGVLMAALDASMAMAARAAHSDEFHAPMNAITVEMKTTFLRPGVGRLRVIGECVHRASSLTFCEAQVRDEDGELIATASGTFKIRHRKPAAEIPSNASPDPLPQA